MIWAKRLGAVVVAAGLIVAAVLVRNEVIEGDDSGTPDADAATTLVCPTEFRTLCEAVAAEHPDLTLRVEPAATTSEAWARAERAPREVWLTVAPLPDIVTAERSRARLAPFDLTTETLGSSQLVVAVPNAKAQALTVACGDPLGWRCIGDTAGTQWSDLDGPAGSAVRPAFAPLDSAVGQLGVTQAVVGYFGNAPVDPGDPGLIPWARRLARAVSAGALSGGTPIATVQVRDSALDVAVGFDAEIANARRDRLTVLYAAPMVRVDLVLATPGGVRVAGDVLATLNAAAAEHGWGASARGETLTAEQVAQATRLWEELA